MNLQVSQEGTTAIVTLNRPERRNALSLELMQDLIAALDEIGRNREIRAVILAASGKVFSALRIFTTDPASTRTGSPPSTVKKIG